MTARRLPLYQALDRDIAAFQDATGLRCPTGCGHCCETQTPYVRISDMMPIARAAVARASALGAVGLRRNICSIRSVTT